MRLKPLCAVVLASASSLVQAGALQDLYRKALEQDQTLKAAAWTRESALQAKPAARAAFLPQVAANASYSLAAAESQFSSLRFGSPVDQTITQKTETQGYEYGLQVQQAVFNWQAVETLRRADNQVALAELGYRNARMQLLFRVTQAYFAVLAAEDQVRVTEVEQKAVARLLEQNQKRFEVGLSAITDVQESQARFDLTNATKVAADLQLAAARRALVTLTGSPDNAVSALAMDLPLAGPEPASPDVWTAAAKEDNLAVLAARLNVKLAEDDARIATSRHYPTLALQGGYSSSAGQFTANGITSDQSQDGYQAQLVLTAPLYNGGAIRAGERAAQGTVEARRADLEAARRTAEQQSGDAYQGVISGMAQVRALQQAVKSAQTALEASQVGVTVGARTTIDVLNAQTALGSAERNLSQARYQYLLALTQLKLVTGRLGDGDLDALDRLISTP